MYILKCTITLFSFLFGFRKVTNEIPAHPESTIMYSRYFFIYYLWKTVNKERKSQIITTAIASLGAPPAAFPPCVLEDVLPKVPKCQPNPVKYLMNQKFDIRKCCELFIQLCRETREDIWQKKSENATTIPNSPKKTTSQLVCTYILLSFSYSCKYCAFFILLSHKNHLYHIFILYKIISLKYYRTLYKKSRK